MPGCASGAAVNDLERLVCSSAPLSFAYEVIDLDAG
jgi:hypothetical protein